MRRVKAQQPEAILWRGRRLHIEEPGRHFSMIVQLVHQKDDCDLLKEIKW